MCRAGPNYCVPIPFTAYYSCTKYVKGTILVNVTNAELREIYYATLKNTNVKFSRRRLYRRSLGGDFKLPLLCSVHRSASGLPGYAVYYNYTSAASYGHKVSASYNYSCTSSGTYKLANITFVPYSGFTGSVSIPYTAYNASGTAVAVGALSFGVINSLRFFNDIQAGAWYYKYVSELSDNSVINGYPDGTFKPSGVVTYGEALKLIMLAAGYGRQNPSGAHWASGYLSGRSPTGSCPPPSVLTRSSAAWKSRGSQPKRLHLIRRPSVRPLPTHPTRMFWNCMKRGLSKGARIPRRALLLSSPPSPGGDQRPSFGA